MSTQSVLEEMRATQSVIRWKRRGNSTRPYTIPSSVCCTAQGWINNCPGRPIWLLRMYYYCSTKILCRIVEILWECSFAQRRRKATTRDTTYLYLTAIGLRSLYPRGAGGGRRDRGNSSVVCFTNEQPHRLVLGKTRAPSSPTTTIKLIARLVNELLSRLTSVRRET